MTHYEMPGEIARKALLLPLLEVDVDLDEIRDAVGPHSEVKNYVRREAEGLIAIGIRHRLEVDDDVPVFITEVDGNARIGDLTWENFSTLIVECGYHKVEFDSYTEYSNFDTFMRWIDGAEA